MFFLFCCCCCFNIYSYFIFHISLYSFIFAVWFIAKSLKHVATRITCRAKCSSEGHLLMQSSSLWLPWSHSLYSSVLQPLIFPVLHFLALCRSSAFKSFPTLVFPTHLLSWEVAQIRCRKKQCSGWLFQNLLRGRREKNNNTCGLF